MPREPSYDSDLPLRLWAPQGDPRSSFLTDVHREPPALGVYLPFLLLGGGQLSA